MTQEHDAEIVKTCPFCGGRASMSKSYDPDTSGAFHHIQCHKCRAKGGEFYAVETCPVFYGQVRDAWNARATLSAMPPREVTVQEAARVLLGVRSWEDMAKAFSAMDARWEDGPEAALAAALRALSGEKT